MLANKIIKKILSGCAVVSYSSWGIINQAGATDCDIWYESELSFMSDIKASVNNNIAIEMRAYLNDFKPIDLKPKQDIPNINDNQYAIKGIYIGKKGENYEMHVGVYHKNGTLLTNDSLIYYRFINNSIPLVCNVLNGTYSPKEVYDLMTSVYEEWVDVTNIGKFLYRLSGNLDSLSSAKKRFIGDSLEEVILSNYEHAHFDCQKILDYYSGLIEDSKELEETPLLANKGNHSFYFIPYLESGNPFKYDANLSKQTIIADSGPKIRKAPITILELQVLESNRGKLLIIKTKTDYHYPKSPEIVTFTFSKAISQILVVKRLSAQMTYHQIQKILSYQFGDILGSEETTLGSFMNKFSTNIDPIQDDPTRPLVSQNILQHISMKKESKL